MRRWPMDVIFLDLASTLDMISHSCGRLLGKWKRNGMVVPSCWCRVCSFLEALLRALYCNHCYSTPSSTLRKMGWTTTRAVVTDDTKLWGTAIQSNLIKLEKWAARDIVESDKERLEINYAELINHMQQHSLGLEWKVCRNRPENPGGQVWVRSAPFWVVPHQSVLGGCNQKLFQKGSNFSHRFCTCEAASETVCPCWSSKCQNVGPNAVRLNSGKYVAQLI